MVEFSLGNLIWTDSNINGIVDPGELSSGGVSVSSNPDEDGDGVPDTVDPTVTATTSTPAGTTTPTTTTTPTPPAAPAAPAAAPKLLAFTGRSSLHITLFGLLLIAAGAGLMGVRRRRPAGAN